VGDPAALAAGRKQRSTLSASRRSARRQLATLRPLANTVSSGPPAGTRVPARGTSAIPGQRHGSLVEPPVSGSSPRGAMTSRGA
jgi:hypothetical protein